MTDYDHLSLDLEFTIGEHEVTEEELADRDSKARITLVIAGRKAGVSSEEIRQAFSMLGIEKEATTNEDQGDDEG